MERLIIGSVAAHKHFPDFRSPKELDVALRWPDGPDYHKTTLNAYWIPELWVTYHKGLYASPNILYTITSALNQTRPTDKLRRDVEFFKNKDCQIIDIVHKALLRKWGKKNGTDN